MLLDPFPLQVPQGFLDHALWRRGMRNARAVALLQAAAASDVYADTVGRLLRDEVCGLPLLPHRSTTPPTPSPFAHAAHREVQCARGEAPPTVRKDTSARKRACSRRGARNLPSTTARQWLRATTPGAAPPSVEVVSALAAIGCVARARARSASPMRLRMMTPRGGGRKLGRARGRVHRVAVLALTGVDEPRASTWRGRRSG